MRDGLVGQLERSAAALEGAREAGRQIEAQQRAWVDLARVTPGMAGQFIDTLSGGSGKMKRDPVERSTGTAARDRWHVTIPRAVRRSFTGRTAKRGNE